MGRFSTIYKNLLKTFREVSCSFLNLLWQSLSTLDHRVHGDHICYLSNARLSHLSKLLLMLLFHIFLDSIAILLVGHVEIEIALDLLDLSFDLRFAGNLLLLLIIRLEISLFHLDFDLLDLIKLLQLVSYLLG